MRLSISSPEHASSTTRFSYQFLVPPFERFRFTLLFIVATGFGWFLIWLVLRSLQDPLLPTPMQTRGLLSSLVVGFVSGIVVSSTQWLVLRRYIADWLWIVAGATGYVLLTVTLESWSGWLAQALALPEVTALAERVSPIVMTATSGVLHTLLAALCAIWLGWLQWLFLRQYTQSSIWWIFVPAIAVILSSSLISLSIVLFSVNIILPLEANVLAAGVLGSTQAIMFCLLQKKERLFSPDGRRSLLAVSPEIVNYGEVQGLGRELYERLNLVWIYRQITKQPLLYWVGVTTKGAVAAYQPMNTAAVEQLKHSPLQDLLEADQPKRENQIEPLALFEVTFLPSGRLRVKAWRGTPLSWLAVSLLIGVLALSSSAAYLLGIWLA